MDDVLDMNTPKPDKDGIVIIDGRRARINADGSFTVLEGEPIGKEPTAADNEHANLDYLINSHPDRLADVDAARARRAELNKEIGNDSDANEVNKTKEKFRAGKLKLQLQARMNIMAQSKQND